MEIRYEYDRLDGTYFPYGEHGPLFRSKALFGDAKYPGEIILPDRPMDGTMAAGTLHEFAHVLQVAMRGEFLDAYNADPVPIEAQASALALSWIAPEHYAMAYEYLAECLESYVSGPPIDCDCWDGDDCECAIVISPITYHLLDSAIADITGCWEKPKVDKRQSRMWS